LFVVRVLVGNVGDLGAEFWQRFNNGGQNTAPPGIGDRPSYIHMWIPMCTWRSLQLNFSCCVIYILNNLNNIFFFQVKKIDWLSILRKQLLLFFVIRVRSLVCRLFYYVYVQWCFLELQGL